MAYKDPEKYREYQRAYRERNREKARLYAAQYRSANPNYMRDWHAKNPNHCSKWREANRERARELWRAQVSRRRARKLRQFIEDVVPSVVFEMHGGMCGICEEFIEGDFHVDHVIPLSKGGMHGYVNVQPAHPLCNLRKGARV